MGAMAAMILRLIALLSVTLMPLGMSTAPGAQPGAHHQAMAGNAAHCGGEDAPGPKAPMESECLACAGLPVSFAAGSGERLLPQMPRTAALAAGFSGIEPEIATPPPRG